ncbi:transcription-repair coupling factor [bacterium]|nr:transcription-repair coupling factor [bacterium]
MSVAFQELLEAYRRNHDLPRVEPAQAEDLNRVAGSQSSLIASALFEQLGRPALCLFPERERAAHSFNDLETLLGPERVLFYPASYRRPYELEETDNANVLMRAEVLNRLRETEGPFVLVSYWEALFEKVLPPDRIAQASFKVKVGDKIGLELLRETLNEYAFEHSDTVVEPGQFSIRGGIVDVFSYAHPLPCRIELYDLEVESLRSFDIESQLSVERLDEIVLFSNPEDKSRSVERQPLTDSLPPNTWLWIEERETGAALLEKHFERAIEAWNNKGQGPIRFSAPEALFCRPAELGLDRFGRYESPVDGGRDLKGSPQPSFNKQFDLLAQKLDELQVRSFETYLVCAGAKQLERFEAIFKDLGQKVSYRPLLGSLHAGFVDDRLKIAVFTDHQIFERYHRFKLKSGFEKQKAITLKELSSLEYGDFITHIDHGVGQFAGLQKIDVSGKVQEAIKLIYRDSDVLYISIHSLHKIARYTGKEGMKPALHKLGSGTWNKLKAKTKSKVREMAFDLIQLYAKRKAAPGFAYKPDTYLQHELEASFIYEDTRDQIKATADVKADMEKPTPMDRLVCGDVGFGKTEIAIRAAFKAVTDGKQVAVLVPTTLLAFQHYKTFSERLREFPCTVDYLNRFKTAKQQRDTLEKLAEGRIDILIGTHRLVAKDVLFKDLGLMIIDEEQKFGVSVKDKLKTIKVNVDTLTLTATPIPRTLQFSLMAARDLSVMTTPPPNRQPIETRVVRFDEATVRDAVAAELERGGQVFFVHNRVESLPQIAGMIQRLVPDARVKTGHGQMDGNALEELMLDFIEGHFDVLVSTTIVENGIDVPNANTILIDQAQNFGLADLHQMRGRVGRSNRKAFCFLIAPPVSTLTEEARKRLNALEQFSDLGSGFSIAMRDLEIRGAGDLLGPDQSGFIAEMGFETYQKILAEAVDELKENEFKELYAHESRGDKPIETQLDTDLEILIPDDYVNQTEERLRLYQTLDNIEDEAGLTRFEAELTDRFGPCPPPVQELLDSMRLRMLGGQLGFEKIILKQGKFIGQFVDDPQHAYFEGTVFQGILESLRHSRKAEMKERNGRLSLSVPDIGSVVEAKQLLLRWVPVETPV